MKDDYLTTQVRKHIINMREKRMSELISSVYQSLNKTKEEIMPPDEKLYIGTKIIRAFPLDECSYLKQKGENVENRETRPGYVVIYDNDYKSWSPEEVFELAYREMTDSERKFINGNG